MCSQHGVIHISITWKCLYTVPLISFPDSLDSEKPQICLLYAVFFSFAQSQIYKLVQYFAFQFSCFHLSKMNLILLSVIAKASICPFRLPNNTPHSLWIHLPIGKFLGYFQNGEIIRLFLTLNVQFFCAYKFLTLLGMCVRVRKMSHMSILYSIL